MQKLLFLGLLLSPLTTNAQSIQQFVLDGIYFVNQTIIPILFSVAFLFFVFNVVRYFIAGGANSDAREKARIFAIYSIAAFVFLVSLWGLVNLLVRAFGFEFTGTSPLRSDYISEDSSYAPERAPLPAARPSDSAAETSPLPDTRSDDSSLAPEESATPSTRPADSDDTPSTDPPENLSETEQAIFDALDRSELISAEAKSDYETLLTGNAISDEEKMHTVADLYDNSVIDHTLAEAYISNLNAARADDGKSMIIVDLEASR